MKVSGKGPYGTAKIGKKEQIVYTPINEAVDREFVQGLTDFTW